MFRLTVPPLAVALVLSTVSSASAQWAGLGQIPQIIGSVSFGGQPRQVFSSNPLGLMVEFYNFEYEFRVSDTITAGAGASRLGWRPFGNPTEPYVNSDAFIRFYPSGSAFNGTAIGIKAGPTKLRDEGSFWGVGFDINQSAALNDHLVVSMGLGLKRLFRPAADGRFLVPTWRIIQIGVGF